MGKSALLTICLGLGVCGLVLAGYLTYALVQGRSASAKAHQEVAGQAAVAVANRLNVELKQLSSAADSLAEELSAADPVGNGLEIPRKEFLETNPEVLAICVEYPPDSPGPSSQPNAPCLVRNEGGFGELQLEKAHSYAIPGIRQDTEAMDKGPGWGEPEWHEALQARVVAYSAPLFQGKGEHQQEASGVVVIFLSVETIGQWAQIQNGGALSWSSVLSGEGRFIANPDERLVASGVPASQLIDIEKDAALHNALVRAANGESGRITHENPLTGQSSWFFFEPVEETGWAVTVVRIRDRFLAYDQSLRRQVIWISLSAILGSILLAGWTCFCFYRRHPSRALLWGLSAFSSLLILGGLIVVRYVVYYQVKEDGKEIVRIQSQEALNSFLSHQTEELRVQGAGNRVLIPTGVLIQSMEFTRPGTLLVTGLVWQKLSEEANPAFSEGFVFPDAVAITISEAYRHSENDGELVTVGWTFEGTLRQHTDVSLYPFDHGAVTLRLWHKNPAQQVQLIPDLASYPVTIPTVLPGLSRELTLPGWKISSSYFDYGLPNHNAGFGLANLVGRESLPELRFNVSLKRHLFNVVIGYGITVLVVLCMLFAVLLSATQDEDRSKLLGFSPSNVMRTCSSLFFVILLAHIHLRSSLQTEEVVLIEAGYFLAYGVILLTVLHGFLFHAENVQIGIIAHEDSLVIKLLYWPVVFGVLLATTDAVLY